MSDPKKINELLTDFSTGLEKILGGKVAFAWLPEIKVDHPIEALKIIIEKITGISWPKIKAPSRKTEIKEARHLFCWFAKKNYGLTLKSIGDMLNGRDHTTVLHSINTVNDLIDAKDVSMCAKFSLVQKAVLEYDENKIKAESPAVASVGQ